jgi:hypothetical protein
MFKPIFGDQAVAFAQINLLKSTCFPNGHIFWKKMTICNDSRYNSSNLGLDWLKFFTNCVFANFQSVNWTEIGRYHKILKIYDFVLFFIFQFNAFSIFNAVKFWAPRHQVERHSAERHPA